MASQDMAVYAIRNKVNGKMYVGSSRVLKQRWNTHLNTLKNSKHHSIKLQRAWDKYGEESFIFEVLEYVDHADELLEAEQMYLSFYECATECGYNVSPVAGSPHAGRKHSEEAKQKMSAAHKKLPPKSEETRQRMSEAQKKSKGTPEARAKQSEISKSLIITPETRAKIADAKRGKPLPPITDEHREKLRAARKAWWDRKKQQQIEEASNGL